MYIAHLSTAVTLNQTVLNTMVFQQRSGHRVAALCPDDEWTGAIRERGIEIIPVPFVRHSLRHSFTSAAAKAYAACRREQFDVVHTHTLLPGIAGRVAARLAGVPAVVHTFHSWPLHRPRGRAFTAVYSALEVLAAHAAHSILFQNEDDLQAWSRIPGMPLGKARLIGNGIDTGAVLQRVQPGARERVRSEFGFSEDTFVVAIVARLELYKGHLVLLQALSELCGTARRPLAALFVGIGKDSQVIEEETARLGLADVVRFTGYRLDVPDLLVASDVSVLPSQYEGIPRALMESMLLEIPVIAADVPGSRTLIRHGENGLLVPFGDGPALAAALRQVMDDRDLAARLALAGRQTVLHDFYETRVADRIEEVYRQVLGQGRPQLSDVQS